MYNHYVDACWSSYWSVFQIYSEFMMEWKMRKVNISLWEPDSTVRVTPAAPTTTTVTRAMESILYEKADAGASAGDELEWKLGSTSTATSTSTTESLRKVLADLLAGYEPERDGRGVNPEMELSLRGPGGESISAGWTRTEIINLVLVCVAGGILGLAVSVGTKYFVKYFY